MSDLKKILDFTPKELTIQQDAKLFFLFNYYAWGINFIDMAYLRWDKHIQEDKEMMGHANEATTEIYLKEFSNDVLSVASEHLNIE